MSQVIHSDIDLCIDEERKEIIINPKGERFYFVGCEEQHKIFRNAILRYNSTEESYKIEGEQTLYTEHKGRGFDYEKLLCLHPIELIKRKSFFGIVWYNVSGILNREVRSVYLCLHKEYRIHVRSGIISKTIKER